MPFTLSHPAAVLPMRHLRLPFAALVAGSVSPDIPYYFTPGKFSYLMDNAHTLPRSFSYCVPAALALLLLLRLLEPAFRGLLPAGPAELARSWLGEPMLRPRALPLTLLALLLGAWTHIAWDDLTHASGHSVRALPFLRLEAAFGFELFRVLQHLSTLLGAAALFWFVARECRALRRPLTLNWSWRWAAWGLAFLLGLAFTAATFTADWNYALTANDRRPGFLFVTSLVRNSCVAAALVAVAVRLARGAR